MTLFSSDIDAGCLEVLFCGGSVIYRQCGGVIFWRMHGDGVKKSCTTFSLEGFYRKWSRR
jgi:hypothetical protein